MQPGMWQFRKNLGGPILESSYEGSYSVGSILSAPDSWKLPCRPCALCWTMKGEGLDACLPDLDSILLDSCTKPQLAAFMKPAETAEMWKVYPACLLPSALMFSRTSPSCSWYPAIQMLYGSQQACRRSRIVSPHVGTSADKPVEVSGKASATPCGNHLEGLKKLDCMLSVLATRMLQ